uniref:Uncharacterized protein n=1 Tax=Rhizophora mucronata TaxID=61149 RepID=A0A2P2LCR3_RHIMU
MFMEKNQSQISTKCTIQAHNNFKFARNKSIRFLCYVYSEPRMFSLEDIPQQSHRCQVRQNTKQMRKRD